MAGYVSLKIWRVDDLGPNLEVEVDKVGWEYTLDMIVVNSFEKFKEVNTRNILDLVCSGRVKPEKLTVCEDQLTQTPLAGLTSSKRTRGS